MVAPSAQAFADLAAWLAWLEAHPSDDGLWVMLAKKGTKGLGYAEALEGALRWGWIDGQKRPFDDRFWLQRFTPRRAKSLWSKINRAKAEALMAAGKMSARGVAEVERARADGRWAAAYDGARTSAVPNDLAAALKANPKARTFFSTLDGANRYAVLFALQTAKKPETRARRLAAFVAMLAQGRTRHPR